MGLLTTDIDRFDDIMEGDDTRFDEWFSNKISNTDLWPFETKTFEIPTTKDHKTIVKSVGGVVDNQTFCINFTVPVCFNLDLKVNGVDRHDGVVFIPATENTHNIQEWLLINKFLHHALVLYIPKECFSNARCLEAMYRFRVQQYLYVVLISEDFIRYYHINSYINLLDLYKLDTGIFPKQFNRSPYYASVMQTMWRPCV